MKEWLTRLFVHQWHRKLTALIAAIIIWALVNHSITITRTIPSVPIRVLNIPEGKTIEGVLPNGLLSRRLTLTVTGQKTTLQRLSPTDIEVVTDAAGKGDRWTFEVTKRNLVSLNPDIDLLHGISSVTPVELTIELSPLVTQKVPVTITRPAGEPPKEFTFLDVWPQRLEQTVSGPKQRVEELKSKGLKLTFDLSKITEEELEELYEKTKHLPEDEVRFFVPESWKIVHIPFERGKTVPLNDPEAAFLHLDFLKQELLPIQIELPVTVFYPPDTRTELNPEKYPLDTDGVVVRKNGLFVLTTPLYARNVSRFFLDTVRDSLEITFVALPASEADTLPWSMEFIDPKRLEEAYVQASLEATPPEEQAKLTPSLHPDYLRQRFRSYLREFELYKGEDEPLKLVAELGENSISITENDAS